MSINYKYELRINVTLGMTYNISITGKTLGKLLLNYNNINYDLASNSFSITETITITKRYKLLVSSLAIFQLNIDIDGIHNFSFTNESPSEMTDIFCFINSMKMISFKKPVACYLSRIMHYENNVFHNKRDINNITTSLENENNESYIKNDILEQKLLMDEQELVPLPEPEQIHMEVINEIVVLEETNNNIADSFSIENETEHMIEHEIESEIAPENAHANELKTEIERDLANNKKQNKIPDCIELYNKCISENLPKKTVVNSAHKQDHNETRLQLQSQNRYNAIATSFNNSKVGIKDNAKQQPSDTTLVKKQVLNIYPIQPQLQNIKLNEQKLVISNYSQYNNLSRGRKDIVPEKIPIQPQKTHLHLQAQSIPFTKNMNYGLLKQPNTYENNLSSFIQSNDLKIHKVSNDIIPISYGNKEPQKTKNLQLHAPTPIQTHQIMLQKNQNKYTNLIKSTGANFKLLQPSPVPIAVPVAVPIAVPVAASSLSPFSSTSKTQSPFANAVALSSTKAVASSFATLTAPSSTSASTRTILTSQFLDKKTASSNVALNVIPIGIQIPLHKFCPIEKSKNTQKPTPNLLHKIKLHNNILTGFKNKKIGFVKFMPTTSENNNKLVVHLRDESKIIIPDIYISSALRRFTGKILQEYGFSCNTNLAKMGNRIIIFGCYNSQDFSVIKHHASRELTIIWGGSDCAALKSNVEYMNYFKKAKNIRHVAISNQINAELIKYSLDVFRHIHFRLLDYNDYPAIADINICTKSAYIYTSLDKTRSKEIYGSDFYEEVIRRLPDINFIIAYGQYSPEEIIKVYHRCFIGIRLTFFDGNANTVQELGMLGIKCIHNGEFPNSIAWSSVNDICDIITEEMNSVSVESRQKVRNDMIEYLNEDNYDWLF